jgi:uncharacterized protein with von Willebrand factor type A (vWA) domain
MALLQLKAKGDAADKAANDAKNAAKAAAKKAADAQAKSFAQQLLEQDKKLIREILETDPILEQLLLKAAKMPLNTKVEEAVLAKLATGVPSNLRRLYDLAAKQTHVRLDLQSNLSREKTEVPTNDIEPMPMRNLNQLSDILPEQLMQDDDAFYSALVQDQLTVLQPFENRTDRKRLYILLDYSNSMKTAMKDQMARHDWSRGLVINLLIKALRGDSEYSILLFAGAPVKDAGVLEAGDEAHTHRLIDWLLGVTATGSGTNLWKAIERGVKDVRATKPEGDIADILLITDGEEANPKGQRASVQNTEALKALLGADIRLHVASIGLKSSWAVPVATTYREFA